MSIQSGINQALSIGAALYTQTPGYAAKREEEAVEAKTKAEDIAKQAEVAQLKKKAANVTEQLENLDMNQPEAGQARETLLKGEEVAYKNLAMADPSAVNWLQFYQNQAIRRQEANAHGLGKQMNRQEQMTGFAQHMANWGKGKRPKVGEING